MTVPPDWHALEVSEVEARLSTTRLGLPEAEAARRLARLGPNRLPEPERPSHLRLLLHQFANPLVFILIAALFVSLIAAEPVDAGVIGAVILINALIGFEQERRAERSIRGLLQLAGPRARVLRGGIELEVPTQDLVPGDVVVLESGARVPADLRVFSSVALLLDDSMLSGESEPVLKQSGKLAAGMPVADRTNMLFAGSVVRSGRGRGYVVATGLDTQLGMIAHLVQAAPRTEPPLQRRLARLGRLIGLVVLGAAALAFLAGIISGRPVTEMFIVAIALAVSAVPEGLPIASTIALTLGVRRMARRHAIVRRLPAVETLGSTTVIGSDKTGTLTENRMTVESLWADGRLVPCGPGGIPATPSPMADESPLRRTLLIGVLANNTEVFQSGTEWHSHGDPTEVALLMAALNMGLVLEAERAQWDLEAELPFEPRLGYSAAVGRKGNQRFLLVKGAPERIIAVCQSVLASPGNSVPLEAALQAAHDLAGRGLRVLAMAFSELPRGVSAEATLHEPASLTLAGLQAMADPPRPGAAAAVARCRAAGIRVVMITGDHQATARFVARAVGILEPGGPVATGPDLDATAPEALEALVDRVSVYARVTPEHKLAIVQALQRRGETVAVTGDGVNDAPALKAADVGVAMGRIGTDVAREAADIVLTNDNFETISAAVEEGRVTFDNIRKITLFLLSTNSAEVIILLVALALGWPLPLLAIQLLWLNLVTEGIQHIALAFEPGEPGIMERPPRPRGQGVLSSVMWERVALAGVVQAVGTLALFHAALARTGSERAAQSVALTTLVVFQSLQVGNSRSNRRSLFSQSPFANRFLLLATALAFGIHLLALHLPFTREALKLEPLQPAMWLPVLLISLSVIVAVEAHKFLRRNAPET